MNGLTYNPQPTLNTEFLLILPNLFEYEIKSCVQKCLERNSQVEMSHKD